MYRWVNTEEEFELTNSRDELPSQISVLTALASQIAPGVASLVIFIVVAFAFRGSEMPLMLALICGVVLGEVPTSWLIIVSRVRKETGGRFDWRVAFPWHRSLSIWTYLLIGLPAIILSVMTMFALIGILSPAIHDTFFTWVPTWMTLSSGPDEIGQLPQNLKYILLASSFVGFALIGGVTQELLARGYILPRISRFGGLGAPVINTVGFTMLHLVAPWDWPAFFAMTLIWSFLVYYFRSVKIGIFVHVGMLMLQSFMMTLMIMGAIAPS